MKSAHLNKILIAGLAGLALAWPGVGLAAPLSQAEVHAQASALPELVIADLPRELFRAVKSVHNRKQLFPWGVAQVQQLRPGFLGDDRLDEHEQRLIAELQKPLFHVRLVALKTPTFAPDDLVLAGTLTPEARTELAKFAPLEGREQLALWLDSGAVGWTKVVAHARRGDEQREEIIDLLVARLQESAQASNLANGFEPFRQRLNGLYNLSNTQRGEDSTFARFTLLRTAAELVHDSGRSGIPLFMVNWIKRGDEEVVAHLLPPVLLATLRDLVATKPFPWGEAEAARLAALVQTEGEPDTQRQLVVKAWLRPKFRLHLVARSPVSGALDTLDLEGSFAPGTTESLRKLLPVEAGSRTN